jgi:hypothetical protein
MNIYTITQYVGLVVFFVGGMVLAYTLGFRHLKEENK